MGIVREKDAEQAGEERGHTVYSFGDDRSGGRIVVSTAGRSSGEVTEYRAFAANLDPRESDLRRATRDDVTLNAPGAEIQSAADPDWVKALRSRRTDFLESIWPFLMLFLLLAGELLLATTLSFHASAAELAAAAPSAASAMQRSTPHVTETT